MPDHTSSPIRLDDSESRKLLQNLSAHQKESQERQLIIALLGKAEVGKSFVCATLASLGLKPEDEKKLASMKLHGKGTTSSFTTVPTEIRWGPKVEEISSSPVRQITVPAPLLKEFNVCLVDVCILFLRGHFRICLIFFAPCLARRLLD